MEFYIIVGIKTGSITKLFSPGGGSIFCEKLNQFLGGINILKCKLLELTKTDYKKAS